MIAMQSASGTRDDALVDPQSYASAILNLLADSVDEKAQLTETQRAVLNLLEDSAEEKRRQGGTQRAVLNILDDVASEQTQLEATQKAVLNILEDSAEEKLRLAETQRAVLNILEDSAEEKLRLDGTQRAVLNILEDVAGEQTRLEATQRAVLNVLADSAEEQARLAETQRAVLNILDDFASEKTKVEQANAALQQAIAAAEAANHELEAFSYSVAHDLRAPLRSIDGFSAALLEDCGDKLDEQGKVYLDYVRESAQQMAKLIDDLLSLSRVTRAELRRSPIDLAAIARTVLAHLQLNKPDRLVDLVIPEEMPAVGDPDLLRIVLENLLGNAWKFTGKCAQARIEFGPMSQAGSSVYFIRDNGIGFDMAYADKLFGVFQRLHSASEFEGTGIGLSIVQRIIRRHGGRVWAEGEVGRGASFYFTLGDGI
jgi:signal transduction histidine kinase